MSNPPATEQSTPIENTVYKPRKSRSRSKTPASEDEFQFLANISRYLLKDVVFYGNFLEKRRVDLLESYRDLIVIGSQEIELKQKINELRKIFCERYPRRNMWLGATDGLELGQPKGHCIWTDVGDLPFGHYWFQIRRLAFRDNEIFLKVKCLRAYDKSEIGQSAKQSEPWDATQYSPDMIAKNFTELLHSWRVSLRDHMLWFCSIRLTCENFTAFIKFIGVVFISLVIGTISGVKFLGEFTIKAMEQLNSFIRAATPFMLGVLDLVSKVIGGLYILIAMMWREVFGSRGNQQMMREVGGAIGQSRGFRQPIMAPPKNYYSNYKNIPDNAFGTSKSPGNK